MRGVFLDKGGKVWGSTITLPLKLEDLSVFEGGEIRGVAVKRRDIEQNSDCEGSILSDIRH